MEIKCDACVKQLDRLGALLFSPPVDETRRVVAVHKYHLCSDCFGKVIKTILEIQQQELDLLQKSA